MASGNAPPGPAPDPAARYALIRLDFDHTHTLAGADAPAGSCGGGGDVRCFEIGYFEINGGSVPGTDYAVENGALTWNWPQSPGHCPFAVPARRATWGRIQSLYR